MSATSSNNYRKLCVYNATIFQEENFYLFENSSKFRTYGKHLSGRENKTSYGRQYLIQATLKIAFDVGRIQNKNDSKKFLYACDIWV